ncbi:MAG: hypothetical protein L0Y75_09100 [Acidobacteria bacterium]|nr:hypothetical protein [Acidobacteriota bacterium]
MLIAKITKSNSHVDYFARVLDSLETSVRLSPADYQFGQFVKISVADTEVIGVIYNSQLINPEYGNYGPRLSTPSELNSVFSPDYLNEQGVMISILLLGWKSGDKSHQGVPRVVLPINSHVETMSDAEVRAFHYGGRSEGDSLQAHYYSHVTIHAGLFAFQLLSAIVDQLDRLANDKDRARLDVLKKTLAWQQTIGRMR